jgi:hypothetical protein
VVDRGEITCIGTFNHISAFAVNSLTLRGYGEVSTATVNLVGNDAVIVSQLLCRRGLAVRVVLLDPTESDIALLRDMRLPSLTIDALGTRRGPVSESVCLQDGDGRRYWLFARASRPSGSILCDRDTLTYVDLYDDVEDYLLEQLNVDRVQRPWRRLFVNLSSGDRHYDKAARIAALSPYVVQASLADEGSLAQGALLEFCDRLRRLSNARYAAATAGRYGAALLGPQGAHYAEPAQVLFCIGIGAGAAFSCGLIEGLAQGVDEADLVRSAVSSAVSHLARTYRATGYL